VPEPSAETSRSSAGARPRREPGALRARRSRGSSPPLGGLEQVLALGDELAQLVAPLRPAELADLLERFVVGAGDGH
jgi:hypothetical protein